MTRQNAHRVDRGSWSTVRRIVALTVSGLVVGAFALVTAQSAHAGSAFGCTTHAANPYWHGSEIDYSGSVTCSSGKYALVVTITDEYFKHTTDTNPSWTGPIPKHTCGYGHITSCSVSSKNQPFFSSGEYCTVTQATDEGEGRIPAARTCTVFG